MSHQLVPQSHDVALSQEILNIVKIQLTSNSRYIAGEMIKQEPDVCEVSSQHARGVVPEL